MQFRSQKLLLVAAGISLAIGSTLYAKNLFIEETKKTVVFIFATDQRGELVPMGTGFFAGVRANPGADNSFLYLVTAKHVLADNSGSIRQNLFVRLNKKDTGSEVLHLDTSISGHQAIFTHTDPMVDLVVVPVGIDDKKFDIKFIQDDMLLSRQGLKDLEISEGSDVFFTGLFLPFFGEGRNYPIVRTGKVALVSDEKIPWRTDVAKPIEKRELLLLETQSFAGNSGSPVFVTAPSTTQPGRTELRLIGVMMGTFEQGNPIAVVQNDSTAVSKQNLGIAAVVPSYFLQEILSGDALKKFRGHN